MAAAIRAGEPLPKMPAELDLNAAYDLQKQVVAARRRQRPSLASKPA